MALQDDAVAEAIRDLLTTYTDLNPPHIDTFPPTDPPSPLEFMRYVSLNRPFVIRRGAADWTALKQWTPAYLSQVMGDSPVNVAITPHGNADSVIESADGSGELLFVKPFERDEPFAELVRRVQEQEMAVQRGEEVNGDIRYGQTQNDNLRHEFAALATDIPASIPFARIALQKPPDAINLWLGNSLSTTAPHKDNYENIYVQVLGTKHFTLLPPTAAACMGERLCRCATYVPTATSTATSTATRPAQKTTPTPTLNLTPIPDTPPQSLPCTTWNPDDPATAPHATAFSALAEPVRVTLEPGDMLYLPALWYHGVRQSCGEERLCVAVNYWYDMDFGGSFWSMANFVRGVSDAVTKRAPGTQDGHTEGDEKEELAEQKK